MSIAQRRSSITCTTRSTRSSLPQMRQVCFHNRPCVWRCPMQSHGSNPEGAWWCEVVVVVYLLEYSVTCHSANQKHIKIRDAVISLPLIQKSRQVTAGPGKILLLDANQCHPRTRL